MQESTPTDDRPAGSQANVLLVDLNETPIERITPNGVKTTDAEYAFDIIIYATGFDAITGSFDRIDFRGLDGLRLKERRCVYDNLLVDNALCMPV